MHIKRGILALVSIGIIAFLIDCGGGKKENKGVIKTVDEKEVFKSFLQKERKVIIANTNYNYKPLNTSMWIRDSIYANSEPKKKSNIKIKLSFPLESEIKIIGKYKGYMLGKSLINGIVAWYKRDSLAYRKISRYKLCYNESIVSNAIDTLNRYAFYTYNGNYKKALSLIYKSNSIINLITTSLTNIKKGTIIYDVKVGEKCKKLLGSIDIPIITDYEIYKNACILKGYTKISIGNKKDIVKEFIFIKDGEKYLIANYKIKNSLALPINLFPDIAFFITPENVSIRESESRSWMTRYNKSQVLYPAVKEIPFKKLPSMNNKNIKFKVKYPAETSYNAYGYYNSFIYVRGLNSGCYGWVNKKYLIKTPNRVDKYPIETHKFKAALTTLSNFVLAYNKGIDISPFIVSDDFLKLLNYHYSTDIHEIMGFMRGISLHNYEFDNHIGYISCNIACDKGKIDKVYFVYKNKKWLISNIKFNKKKLIPSYYTFEDIVYSKIYEPLSMYEEDSSMWLPEYRSFNPLYPKKEFIPVYEAPYYHIKLLLRVPAESALIATKHQKGFYYVKGLDANITGYIPKRFLSTNQIALPYQNKNEYYKIREVANKFVYYTYTGKLTNIMSIIYNAEEHINFYANKGVKKESVFGKWHSLSVYDYEISDKYAFFRCRAYGELENVKSKLNRMNFVKVKGKWLISNIYANSTRRFLYPEERKIAKENRLWFLVSTSSVNTHFPNRQIKESNMIDGKNKTIWLSAGRKYVKEWIRIDLMYGNKRIALPVKSVKIVPAFIKNKKLYKKFSRIRSGYILLRNSNRISFTINDTRAPHQVFDYVEGQETDYIYIVIREVYPGKIPSIAISDIEVKTAKYVF